MGFAVRTLDAAIGSRLGRRGTGAFARHRADRAAELSAAVAVVRGALGDLLSCRGPRRGGWPIASASRRFATTTATGRRPTSSATTTIAVDRLPRHRAERLERHPGRPRPGDVIAETAGRVHRGFKREVDDLWPRLEQALVNNTRPLWFAGHSLGGAMATICAEPLQALVHPVESAGALHLWQPARRQSAAT